MVSRTSDWSDELGRWLNLVGSHQFHSGMIFARASRHSRQMENQDTSGEGHEISSHPSVFVDGILGFAVLGLSKVWGRSVSVPKELAKKRVKRTLSGSQEEIARTLGLQLGTKRKAPRKPKALPAA